jgi:acetoin utilization protein AcuB
MLGMVTYNDLLRNASDFMSLNNPGALIVLELKAPPIPLRKSAGL